MREQETNGAVKSASQSWTEVVQGTSSSRKLSWVEEVETMEEVEKKSSVWDNFDIGKIANAGFKLEFVASKVHGESTICETEIDDITDEIAYWLNAVVCYVLGAQPPFTVLNGYIQ